MNRSKGHSISLILFAALLMMSSCSDNPGGQLKTKSRPDSGPLSAYVKQEMVRPPGDEYKFVKGGVSRPVFAIENNSNDVIILTDCSIKGQLPDIDRWYGARYGSAEYRPIEDTWKYNQMAQQLSKPVFAMGVILPHDSIEVEKWGILKEKTVQLDVAYQRLSKEQARNSLYVETVHTPLETGRDVFVHPEHFSRSTGSGIAVNWHFVIFPETEKFPVKSQSLLCSVSLREPKADIKTAQSVIKDEIRDSVYWENRNMWAVKTDKGKYLVDGKKAILLPELDLLAFVIIESSYKRVDFILPLSGYEKFDPQKPSINEVGYFNPGVTKVLHENISELFAYTEKKGDGVTIFPYDPSGLGSNYYLLVGEFDEKRRREIAGKLQ